MIFFVKPGATVQLQREGVGALLIPVAGRVELNAKSAAFYRDSLLAHVATCALCPLDDEARKFCEPPKPSEPEDRPAEE